MLEREAGGPDCSRFASPSLHQLVPATGTKDAEGDSVMQREIETPAPSASEFAAVSRSVDVAAGLLAGDWCAKYQIETPKQTSLPEQRQKALDAIVRLLVFCV